MNFRKAVKSEENEIYNLYKSVLNRKYCIWNELYPAKEDLKNDIAGNNLFVLLHQERIIGAISIVSKNEMDSFKCWKIKENAAEFARVVIHPDYQNRHLSSLLIEGIIEELRKRRISAIHISIAIKNIPAQKLYKSYDFSFLEEVMMYGNSYWLAEKEKYTTNFRVWG